MYVCADRKVRMYVCRLGLWDRKYVCVCVSEMFVDMFGLCVENVVGWFSQCSVLSVLSARAMPAQCRRSQP